MRLITSRDYDRLLSNLWYTRITKTIPSGAKKEQISWLLDTAQIRPTGHGGNVRFDDIVGLTTSVENLNAAAGLKVKKEQFQDLDGNGIDLATHWSRTVGAYAAYWPQKSVAKAILANPVTYDGFAFFYNAHPVNPFIVGGPTYSNINTAGSGVGAVPIDDSVTVDVAIKNLAKVIAGVANIKMPNGVDPRFLRVGTILHPPAMTARVQQLTNAKFIAQAAASGGGSGDVEATIRNFGLGQPVEVPELAAAFGGSDTTYYIATEDILTSDLGAFCYVNREPFTVLYYGPQTDAQLARIKEFQWTSEGRNVVMPGHPFLLFKCLAA
jgi:hypothetical protein